MANENDDAMTVDEDELEIFVDDEIIPVPDVPGLVPTLEHPSVARIKESEGIPVKKYQPVRVKTMESEYDIITIVEREDSPVKSKRPRPVRVLSSKANETNSGNSRSIEDMSLDDVIAMRKEDFERPKRYDEMSLSEVIQVKKVRGEIPAEPKFSKRCKTSENGFTTSENQYDQLDFGSRKIPRGRSVTAETSEDFVRSEFKAPRPPRGPKTLKYTPEAGLRLLAELGFLIVCEVSHMKNESHPLYTKRRWRACYYDGRDEYLKVMGIGEAPRKALAKHSAALDFLEKLREAQPELKIPECEVPQGCRLSPYVLVALESLCSKLEVDEPMFTEDLVVIRGREKYKFTIHIGKDQFWDASYDLKFAKYMAAKKAYDQLSDGREFHYDPVIKGDECLKDTEYTLIESDEVHVVHANKQPPVRSVDMEQFEFIGSAPSTPTPGDGSAHESSVGSGRSSAGSTTSSAMTTRKILVSTMAQSVMPPKFIRVRKSTQRRKVGLSGPGASDDVPENDNEEERSLKSRTPEEDNTVEDLLSASGVDENILEEQRHSEDTEVDHSTGEDVSENISFSDPRLSSRDPRLKHKFIKASAAIACDPEVKKFFSSDYVQEFWTSEVREKVLSQIGKFKDAVNDDETLTLETENLEDTNTPDKSRFCVMTFTGYGYSGSFKVANLNAKASLEKCIKTAQKIIEKDKLVPPLIKFDGEGSDDTGNPGEVSFKRRNPFHVYE